MKGAGANFHIQRLHYHAALLGPVVLQGPNNILKCADIVSGLVTHLK
jgi:hypothetical protein